jgi:hypothetical protein
MERQLMINALQSGVGQLQGATLEEKMADFRNKQLQQSIIASEATRFGLGQTTGPSQFEADPLYRATAAKAQAEMAKRGAALRPVISMPRKTVSS